MNTEFIRVTASVVVTAVICFSIMNSKLGARDVECQADLSGLVKTYDNAIDEIHQGYGAGVDQCVEELKRAADVAERAANVAEDTQKILDWCVASYEKCGDLYSKCGDLAVKYARALKLCKSKLDKNGE